MEFNRDAEKEKIAQNIIDISTLEKEAEENYFEIIMAINKSNEVMLYFDFLF
jgi:hypothetical protein